MARQVSHYGTIASSSALRVAIAIPIENRKKEKSKRDVLSTTMYCFELSKCGSENGVHLRQVVN